MPETRFRWVRHSVEGLRLFFDIMYGEDETCSEEDEVFVKEIDLPTPVLHMLAGQTVPEIPEQIRDIDSDGDRNG